MGYAVLHILTRLQEAQKKTSTQHRDHLSRSFVEDCATRTKFHVVQHLVDVVGCLVRQVNQQDCFVVDESVINGDSDPLWVYDNSEATQAAERLTESP